MSNDKIKPPSGDELRALCRNASFSASDPASNVECAAAGYRAGWQACAEAMQPEIDELERLCDATYVAQGADAYNYACDLLEQWNNKRIDAGKQPCTQRSLCDGLASLFSMLAKAEAMQQDQRIPEWDGMDQDWKGMSGAMAFHLIDRHADNWGQLGAMMNAWLEANKVQQDAATLRQAITNIHDRILRGDSDSELMAMCDAALGGTGINGLTREEESQTASVMGIANQDHIPDAGEMVKDHVADTRKLVPAKRLSDEEIEDMWGESNRGYSIEKDHYFKAARDAEAKILGEQS